MSNYNINDELTTLEETKVQIKEAIIGKGQSISDSDSFRSYASKISAIETGGIDTSDATATVDDIALNRTAYVKGQKITGTLQVTGSMSMGTNSVEYTEVEQPGIEEGDSTIVRTLYTRGTINNKKIVSANTTIELLTDASNVASAIGLTANKIKKDETILGVTGIYEGSGGIDTSDATAVDTDLVSGKTAYVKGQKITGSITELPAGGGVGTRLGWLTNGDGEVGVISFFGKDFLMRDGSDVVTTIPNATLSEFIGLTADKLKRGETILGIDGTLDAGIDTSDATATASDIAEGVTAYVDGQKVTGTVYAVEQDSSIIYDALNVTNYSASQKLRFNVDMLSSTMFRTGATNSIDAEYSDIADALGISSEQIVLGNTILGVDGSFSGIDTSDADANVNDILSGKTAYVNGSKLTGTYVPVMTQEEYDSALAKAQLILGGV